MTTQDVALQARQNASYVVIDRQTGQRATRTVYTSLRAACRAVDRFDNQYGGYRYQHQRVEA